MSIECNNPRTLEAVRQKIEAVVAEAPLADTTYDYGLINGWIGALYWAGHLDLVARDELQSEARAAFEQRPGWLGGAVAQTKPADCA